MNVRLTQDAKEGKDQNLNTLEPKWLVKLLMEETRGVASNKSVARIIPPESLPCAWVGPERRRE